MKLTDLETKNVAVKALKESFSMNFDVSDLDKSKTRTMLSRIKGLISESKRSPEFHKAQNNPAYLKLVFMEQALSQHMKVAKEPRIVFENEEVEKSQVILAAQDMVDSIQKMIEQVNDMLVKELPALVDSIENDIGVNESQQFSQQATGALQTLNQTLPQTKEQMKAALSGLTGGGGMNPDAFGAPGADMGMPAMPGAEAGAMPGLPAAGAPPEEAPPEEAPEEPEEEVAAVGREKR
jgi:hypothetical protein